MLNSVESEVGTCKEFSIEDVPGNYNYASYMPSSLIWVDYRPLKAIAWSMQKYIKLS